MALAIGRTQHEPLLRAPPRRQPSRRPEAVGTLRRRRRDARRRARRGRAERDRPCLCRAGRRDPRGRRRGRTGRRARALPPPPPSRIDSEPATGTPRVTSSRRAAPRSSASTSHANHQRLPATIPLPQRRSDASRTRQTSAKPDGTSSQRPSSSAPTELRLLSYTHRHHVPHPDSAIGPAPTATNPPPVPLQIRIPGPEPDYPQHTSWGAVSLARGPHQTPCAAGAGAGLSTDSQSVDKSVLQSTLQSTPPGPTCALRMLRSLRLLRMAAIVSWQPRDVSMTTTALTPETILRAEPSELDGLAQLREQLDAILSRVQTPRLIGPDGEAIDLPEAVFEALK